jgi:3-hydroxyisobutyrate dehydrogenase-like beta-hydroxyacid dehydrogenase
LSLLRRAGSKAQTAALAKARVAATAFDRTAFDALASGRGSHQDSFKRGHPETKIMTPVVAVIAPGMMGAAVGGRLVAHGLKVLTSLQGRSAETAARAKAAGMAAASDEEISAADFILSILPPGDAVSLAQRFAPALTASNSKPVYVDCNAISPPTVARVADAIAPTGSPFVDAGIIGSPPKPKEGAGPRFYASGPSAPRFAALKDYGLDIRVLGGPLSAASALKMSYAGITKGTQALGAVMMLAATRGGSADALFAELKDSQPQMLAYMQRTLSIMPPKAYRWIAEMQEIANFVGEDPAGHELYSGAAHFYEQVARDFAGDRKEVDALMAFLNKGGK